MINRIFFPKGIEVIISKRHLFCQRTSKQNALRKKCVLFWRRHLFDPARRAESVRIFSLLFSSEHGIIELKIAALEKYRV